MNSRYLRPGEPSWLLYISVTDSLLERVFSVDYLVYDCDSDGDMGSIVKVRLDT
jgi:hypothetical protein